MTPLLGGDNSQSIAESFEKLDENDGLRRRLEELRFALDKHSIIAITDRRGTILDANEKFVELSKFTLDELIGSNQNIVNSGYHSVGFWRELWRTISSGQVWQGEICNRAKDGSEYWVATTIAPLFDDEGRPDRYISLRTDVTQIHTADARVRKAAFEDPLTGLMNQTAAIDMLDDIAKLDCDEFRLFITIEMQDLPILTDAFGFAEAESLLQHASEILTNFPEMPDAVARLNTEVFGLFYSGLGNDRELAEQRSYHICDLVSEALSATIQLDLGFTLHPTLKVGFVLFGDDKTVNGPEIFNRAEIARRLASENANVLVQRSYKPRMFEPEMFEETQKRVNLVQDLRRSISLGALRLSLQPIVDAKRGITGYEALVRLWDEEKGLVPPSEFIPLAEQTGLVVDIGSWVLKEAWKILADWSKDPKTRHLTLSINISERQLRTDKFVSEVVETFEASDAPDITKLTLEVLESVLISDLDGTIARLAELQRLGLRIALDDFGTGYSSLSYLVKLPLQILKIDRSFVESLVKDNADVEVVRTIIDLAHTLQLQVVAEGVETELQFDVLRTIGTDFYQGYYFGRPELVQDFSYEI